MKIRRKRHEDAAEPTTDVSPAGTGLRRFDGWESTMTGFGTSRDKGISSIFNAASFKAFEEYETLLFEDPIYAAMCGLPVEEAVRQGYTLDLGSGGEGEQEHASQIVEYMEEKQVPELLEQAGTWARGIGGSAILMGIDDGGEMIAPLNEANIKSVLYLKVLSARSLIPNSWYRDPIRDAKFGEPETYYVRRETPGALGTPIVTVHESRIIRFDGFKTVDRRLAQRQGWGEPLAIKVEESLQRFWSAAQGMSNAIADADQFVLKLKDLFKIATSNAQGREQIRARMEQMTNMRSVLRTLALDKDEDAEYVSRSFAGYDSGLYAIMYLLSAVSSVPMRLLFGKVPGGFSDTGESEINFFYGRVKRYQEVVMMPRQKRLITILASAKDSGLTLPKKWSIGYRPLMQMTPVERADLRLKTSQADQIDLDAGVLTPEEVASSHYAGNEYNPEITLRDDLRDADGDLEPPEPDELDPAVGAAMGLPPKPGEGAPEVA